MGRRKKKQNKKARWSVLLILTASIIAFGYFYRYPIYRTAQSIYNDYIRSHRVTPPKKMEAKYALGVALPKNYKLFGTDVSRHQGKIDWDKLSKFRFDSCKISFVFIKATEGQNWVDKEFKKNWKQAKAHNIYRGAYHFYRPKVHSEKQMKNFTSVVKLEKGDLPPVLDVEIESSLPKSRYRQGVLNCLAIMEKTYGLKPIIYTNQKLYREYFKHSKFKSYRFWISRLKSTPPRMDEWHFWQFTYEAVIDGTNEYVDMNVFNGSLEELKMMRKN